MAPTVVEPSGRWGATAFIAAFSMRATMAGVANTSMSPEPMVRAVLAAVTVVVLMCFSPFSMIMCMFIGYCVMQRYMISTGKMR